MLTSGLAFFAMFAVTQVMWIGAQLVVTAALRIPPTALTLGAGPLVWATTVRGARAELRLLPLVASVSFRGMRDVDPETQLPRLSLPREVMLTLGPWLVVAGLGVVLVGVDRALPSFGDGFLILFTPPRLATRLHRFAALVGDGHVVVALGLLLLKVSAFNLLPFPPLGGGGAARRILQAASPTAARTFWQQGSLMMLVMLAVAVGWAGGLWMGWL